MARLAEKFVDIVEVAKYLGVSRRTADRFVAGGFIPYYRLPSGRKRFDLEEISEWLKNGAKRKRI